MNRHDALRLVLNELIRASEKHREFHSPHEAYAVIKEELDELWEEIRKLHSFDERSTALRTEAVQVAAMAVRFLEDLT